VQGLTLGRGWQMALTPPGEPSGWPVQGSTLGLGGTQTAADPPARVEPPQDVGLITDV
jgi:hypothetical protein